MNKMTRLDKEEKELLKSLDSGEWVSDFGPSIKKKCQEYAKYSISKKAYATGKKSGDINALTSPESRRLN